jgi:phosphonate ABC transporter permease subunit PhnE
MMNSNNPPSSQDALRRLLVVLAILVGVVVYAYGWQVTDIDIEETQDERRQASVQRALRELFAPDIFDQDTESVFMQADFLMNCSDTPPVPPEPTHQPYIALSPTCGSRGDIVTVEGFNFEPGSPAALRWVPPAGEKRPLDVVGTESNVIDTDASGHFRVDVEVPSIRGSQDTVHQIEVESRIAVGTPRLSDSTLLVIEKMIETIFLALMATTVAVPISVVLSFLAAHNLMPQVRIPLGSALVGLILLPVGWFLGALLLGPIGQLGVNWGKALVMGIVGPVVAIAAYGFGAQVVNQLKLKNGAVVRLRTVIMSLLLLVLVIFVIGAVGGLAVWLGSQLGNAGDSIQTSPGIPAAVAGTLVEALGNFIGTLGRIIEISMAFIAAVAGAFLLAWNGMELSVAPLKSVSAAMSHALGGIFGVLGGALMMVLVALIGTQGALLTLLAPLVAAVLASQLPVMIYDRWISGHKSKRTQTTTDQTLRTILALIAGVVAFAWTYVALDVGRSIVEGRLPAAIPWVTFNLFGTDINLTYYLRDAALIGAVLGGIAGLLSGVNTPFPIGSIIYNATRTILNALRSIEPLIMGIVFVIWVGIGPFAGVLALTLHSIASLGKLYSEQIESIDPGPIEAILATGANRLQMIVYAVVPQIVPPYIAFTMYRWDINVRMSTIIGFVGGGGIGFLLQQQINLLRYRDAGVAVLAIAIVVSVLDYASAYIRERMV